jgi:hypothetical protein
MNRVLTSVFAFGTMALLASALPQAAATADAPKSPTPKDRVAVMYFHRTQRCPTCLKMGGYSEEAVKTGFAKEIKDRKVTFHFIDFQDEKNAAFTKGYKVAGPTLVVARIANNKVAEYKSLDEMWTKVRDKEDFINYVQVNVKEYQK